jgi:hypothetical protein
MAIDAQLPDCLPALGQQINAEHNFGPVNQQFNVNINMALTNVVFSGAKPLAKTPPDVYMLWAKHFSPVGCPPHVIQIPKDWAAFFTVMLLSPAHFDWAKTFLTSQAWNLLLQCSNSSSFMSFALPPSCPKNAEVRGSALEDEPEVTSSQHGSNGEIPLLFLQPKLSHLHLLWKLKLGEAQESVAKMEGLGTIVVPTRIAWPVLPHLQA